VRFYGPRLVELVSETTEHGVTERAFELKVDGELVPGILWSPADSAGPRPTVLIGHGGTQHKRVPNVLALARRLVRHLGYAAVSLDAPGHGERITDPAAAQRAAQGLQERMADGRGGARGSFELSPEEARAWAQRTTTHVREWSALLDDLAGTPDLADGPFGYWGVSMGTIIGLPFVASEPRITAAVLGLAGLSERAGGADFEAAARSLRQPVLFLFQWDDELMTRESGLALFDAIGSKDKTLHVNPGGHIEMPLHEREAVESFFRRHLGAAQRA
jgi:pimeloyl-ACP methyl ester carboxylesterase